MSTLLSQCHCVCTSSRNAAIILISVLLPINQHSLSIHVLLFVSDSFGIHIMYFADMSSEVSILGFRCPKITRCLDISLYICQYDMYMNAVNNYTCLTHSIGKSCAVLLELQGPLQLLAVIAVYSGIS